jgi:hypothetical protein
VSFNVAFTSNDLLKPFSFAGVQSVKHLPNGDSIPFEVTVPAGGGTVHFALGPLDEGESPEEIQLESVELVLDTAPARISASTLDELVNSSISTPIGTGQVIRVQRQADVLLVSILFHQQRLGPSVLGAGAGAATLTIGDVRRSTVGTGLTPTNDEYVEALNFRLIGGSDGREAQLELREWRVLVPSIRLSLAECSVS